MSYLISFFLFLTPTWGQQEVPGDFKIDDKFREANRLDLSDLYQKPVDENISSNKAAQISSEKLNIKKNDRLPKVEIIFDSSGSMGQIIGTNKTRMYAAKRVIAKFFKDQWKENALLGLRVYGSRKRNDCKDSYLAVPFGQKNIRDIQRRIAVLLPIGRTPLMKSVDEAIKDIEEYPGTKKIIVFTDGKDTCGGDLCKFAKKLRERTDVNVKVYTVGIDFTMNEKDYDQVACLGESGKNLTAENEDELFDAMAELSQDINPGINLKVISPLPKSQVNLYKIVNGQRQFYRSFTAAWGIRVPPGVYQADVLLAPTYRFPPFRIPEGERVTLKVEGMGKIKIEFPKGLMDAQLLDANGKVVHHFKSGSFYRVKMGRYALKVFRKPYFEEIIPDVLVIPNGEYKFPVPKAGAALFRHKKTVGYYIYLQSEFIGHFLTNVPIVLPRNDYRFFLSEDCNIRGVPMGNEKKWGVTDCEQARRAEEKERQKKP